MGLRTLLDRLKARFRPSAVVPAAAPAEDRDVPRLELSDTWEGAYTLVTEEMMDDMMREFEEEMAALQDAFRGPN